MKAAVDDPLMPHSDLEAAGSRRRALSKVAWRFLPVLTIAYVLNYLDRTSVGIAALTMNRDLGLTAYEFGWGAGLLFASYSIFEIPSNLILYRFGARRWIARIMITWGVVAAANAFVVGPNSFYSVRLLLGAAEAGFFPGITFFLAAWFPERYRARVLAWFLVAIPVSSVLGGPISSLLLEMDGLAGLAGWQWMFIVEGLPASIVGFFILMMLSDRPEEAEWLSAEERAAMVAMLAEEQRDRARHSVLSAIKDVRVLILTGIQFGYTLGSYGIGIWLPQILKTHGLSNLAIGFISAVPYLFASVAMLVWAAWVDRAGHKILNLTLGFLLATVGFVLSVGWTDLVPGLIGLTIALVGVTSARAIFWTVPTSFLTGRGAAGGLAFISTIGSLGGFAGPFLIGWIKDSTGSFIMGLLAMAAILAVTTALSALLRLFVHQDQAGIRASSDHVETE
jgi:ACS family tartrate transporter-like MFS transporter